MTIRMKFLASLSVSIASSFLVCSTAFAEAQVEQSTAEQNKVEQTTVDQNTDEQPASVASNSSRKDKAKHNHKRKNAKESAKELEAIDAEALEVKRIQSFQNKKQPLTGQLTYIDLTAGMGQGVSELTFSAVRRQPKYQEAERAVKHYRTKVQRSVRFAKDAINYAIPYRGFSMSIEGSKVLLNKDQKLNNLCIAELMKQKYIDEMHPQITASIMQIATGLGDQNPEASQREVEKGVTALEKLVGKEEAESVKNEMVAWYQQLNISDSAFQNEPWDVDTSYRIYQKALDKSADGDPLIYDICKRVKKYIHCKLFNMTAGAVESTLSGMTILSGNPLASLGAEAANTAFVMSTGGPEENKILKELYFGRRMEIRRKRLSDEVQLALSNYEKSQLTHNRAQLAVSEIVLSQLVGPEALAEVLERDPVSDIAFTGPIELAKAQSGK